jgi:FdhD protein
MATSKYEGLKYQRKQLNKVFDDLTVEEGLRISVNGKPLTVTMRTPGDDIELVHGLLYSEDIYSDVNSPLETILEDENDQGIVTGINVKIDESKLGTGYKNSRSFLSVASCGICGKQGLDLPDPNASVSEAVISPNLIFQMFTEMNSSQDAYKQSGGSHASAAFSEIGELLCIKEDIGRHNAVDKVVGHLIFAKGLDQAKCITVSGRVSYEIIIKVFRAKIPVLAAVSAPSTLAIDFAKELGITVLAFCREDRLTCYSHPERLVRDKLIQVERQENA